MADTPRDDGPPEPPPPPRADAADPLPPGDATPLAIHQRGLLLASRFGAALRRALFIGLGIAVVTGIAVGLMVPAVTGAVGAVVVAALAGVLTGTSVAFLSVDTRVRLAFESFSWLGRRELDRVRARTGMTVPTSADGIDAWLRTVPLAPATVAIRAEMLAMIGRTAQARAELASVPASTDDLQRLERASVGALIGFVETGRLDQREVVELVEGLDPASELGVEGAVVVAVGEARRLAAVDDPGWTRPLEAVRPRIGRDAVMVTLRDTWSKVALQYAVGGGLAALLADALRGA